MTNRVAKYLDLPANARTRRIKRWALMPNGQTKAVAARSAFGERFATIMARTGKTTPAALAKALTEYGVPTTDRQISYLYTVDYKTAADVKEPGERLKACAELAGVSVDAFFGDEPEAAPSPSSELLDMAAKALQGPKAEFLADAIDMAYAAAVTSRSRRHS
jgi:hypothetical protein